MREFDSITHRTQGSQLWLRSLARMASCGGRHSHLRRIVSNLPTSCRAGSVLTWTSNIWGEPILPHMQNAFMPVYVAAFIGTIAVMWALCPHVDAHAALIEVTNEGGWSSNGLALMVGQISAIFALGGKPILNATPQG